MNFDTIQYERINETMHVYNHESGLKAFVIPKKGYSKKYAAFATNYGSINNEFVIQGDTESIKVPDGIAHFLEHKLFEQKDGSVMDKFSRLGASPNAYTSFAQTVYLFSSTERFIDNFDLLLDFVQNPYITEESVEKEKGIIGQEIQMYQDNPGWRVFFNLLDALYKLNPVKIDIAGSLESISKINRDVLYKCYNTFYSPSNMIVLVVGDVDEKEVFNKVEEKIKHVDSKLPIERIFPQEPKEINRKYVKQKLSVSTPLFEIGFKDINFEGKGTLSIYREIAVKILLQMIMGRSSELFNRLYNKGLVNNTFSFEYSIEQSYAYSMFGGESPDPEAVKQIVSSEIEKLRKEGLDFSGFERVKRAMTGRFLKQLNSVERISHMFISVYFRDINVFDYFDVYDRIDFEYVNDVFLEHFNLDRMVTSVIEPL